MFGVLVLLLALGTRTLYLGAVHQVVFDEVHFGKFISSYCCTHERFFDIHPPIGKLIIAGGAYMSGYNGKFPFTSIGQEYDNIPIASIRIVTALAGSLLAVIIFILLRQTGVSPLFSALGGAAVALDNALVLESRLIITDSILLSATFGAIACAFACVRSSSSLQSFLWAIAAGIASGVAVGTKFTGLVGGALVGVILLHRAYKGGYREAGIWIARLVVAMIMCAFIYLIGWMLHFYLLTMPGSGDVWGIPTGDFWHDLVTIQQQMVSANYNLTAAHPYGSKWWTWPFMVRSVFYWQGQGNQFIYLIGNPIVWWGSFFLFCLGVVSLFFRIASGSWTRVSQVFSSGAWVFLLGYFVSFVPLMRVPRVLFLYHYLTPLLFSLLFALWWVDIALPKRRNVFVAVALVSIFLGFVFIGPVTYGITLPDAWYNLLFAITSWR